MPRSALADEAQLIGYMKTVAVGRSGFSSFLSFEPLRGWDGIAEILVKVRPKLMQYHGFVHGEIVGLMADSSCAWAASSSVGDVVTGSYTINFLTPAKGDLLRSKGSVVKAWRRQVVVRSDVWSESSDQEPALVAVTQSTMVPTGLVKSSGESEAGANV